MLVWYWYIFFGEVSDYIFCISSLELFVFLLSCKVFFANSGYKFFTVYVFCKCFLLLSGLPLSFFLNAYLFLRERQGASREGAERWRHRIWSRLQALSCQHRARHGARTRETWDHDLSQSWTLNRLSHPGAPAFIIFLTVSFEDQSCIFWWSPVDICHLLFMLLMS